MESKTVEVGCFELDVHLVNNSKSVWVENIVCKSQDEIEKSLKDLMGWILRHSVQEIVFRAGNAFKLPDWFKDKCKKNGVKIKVVGQYIWSNLNHLQLGKYAEYYVKMMFLMYGFDVYTPEVDDKGIDFIIVNGSGNVFKMQVKSIRGMNYVFVHKDKFPLSNDLFLVLVVFNDGKLPEIYLIPSIDWSNTNDLLVDRDYKDKKSKPEYGLNLSNKNMKLLEKYKIEKHIGELFK